MKVVAITGASSGIGLATAKYYSNKGFEVILIARNLDKLKAAQKSLKGPSHIVSADISTTSGVDQTLSFMTSEVGVENLGFFIHNAGVFKPQNANDFSEDCWTTQFNTNLLSVMKLNSGLFEVFKHNAPFSIMHVSSTAGLRPISGLSIYAATKAALNNYTQNLALEWATYQIRVNAVCPGIVDTPIHSFEENSKELENANKLQPLSRIGQPIEVAKLIYDVAGNDWMTGSLVTLDGGITLV